MKLFSLEGAPSLDETGMMTHGHIDEAVRKEVDFTQVAAGQIVSALFAEDRPDGLSLVHGHFKPGYRLPRHSHSANCLYYILEGEAVVGNRSLKPGEGMFVPAGSPYQFEAGPEGVKFLEFRDTTEFDIQYADQSVEAWQRVADAAAENHHLWTTE